MCELVLFKQSAGRQVFLSLQAPYECASGDSVLLHGCAMLHWHHGARWSFHRDILIHCMWSMPAHPEEESPVAFQRNCGASSVSPRILLCDTRVFLTALQWITPVAQYIYIFRYIIYQETKTCPHWVERGTNNRRHVFGQPLLSKGAAPAQ